MRVALLKFGDLRDIEEIHKRSHSYPIPEIRGQEFIVKNSIFNDEKLVAAAFVRLTTESIVITDSKLSKFSRAKAYKTAVESIISSLGELKINSTYVGTDSEILSRILKKHYGFVRENNLLYLEVNNG